MTINVDGLWGFYAVMSFFALIGLVVVFLSTRDVEKSRSPKKAKHVGR